MKGITMQKQHYFLAPVEVVKVTSQNMQEVAQWCGGKIAATESRRVEGRMDNYVWVPTPKGTSISWAFPGMYITKRLVAKDIIDRTGDKPVVTGTELKATFAVFRKDYFDKNYFADPKAAVDATWERYYAKTNGETPDEHPEVISNGEKKPHPVPQPPKKGPLTDEENAEMDALAPQEPEGEYVPSEIVENTGETLRTDFGDNTPIRQMEDVEIPEQVAPAEAQATEEVEQNEQAIESENKLLLVEEEGQKPRKPTRFEKEYGGDPEGDLAMEVMESESATAEQKALAQEHLDYITTR